VVNCPAGKQAINADYDISGGKAGAAPNTLLEVVADQVATFAGQGFLSVYETDSTTDSWSAFLTVLCADATP
jgi:hypothetical protein